MQMIYFEEPGHLNSDGYVKTVSQGLAEHTGFGVALLTCIVIETSAVLSGSSRPIPCAVIVYGVLASLLGVLIYPSTGLDTQTHNYYAGGFFGASILLSWFCWYEGRAHWAQPVAPSLVLIFLAVAFVQWPAAVGILEIIYLSLMINSWAPRVKDSIQWSMTSSLFV